MMKLFLFNTERVFTTKDITERVKSPISKVRHEVSGLNKMGLVRKRVVRGKNGFVLNQQFSHLKQLQSFLIEVEPLQPKEIIKKLSRSGSIKVVITTGVFLHDPESRADLLVIGDSIKKNKFENAIKAMEAEIGKELRYAYFSTDEFRYRLSMYDKLIRDILDYPHRVLLDKLGILEEGGV
jgi:hypothetical protein